MNLVNYIVARASEASTWRGLALLATSLGIYIQPDLYAQITSVGMAVAGLVGTLAKDKSKE